jgi:hypothetical protein
MLYQQLAHYQHIKQVHNRQLYGLFTFEFSSVAIRHSILHNGYCYATSRQVVRRPKVWSD